MEADTNFLAGVILANDALESNIFQMHFVLVMLNGNRGMNESRTIQPFPKTKTHTKYSVN